MDRSIIYSLQQIRSFDVLWQNEDTLVGAANYAQMILGSTGTFAQDIIATQTTPASLVINLSPGFIIQQAPADTTAYGSLTANSQQIMQQGYTNISSVTISAGALNSGQNQYVLIEAGFVQTDAIRAGDPNGGVLPYININNPTQPFNGPNNSGVAQDTVRQGICNIQVTYGSPATTGTEVPPAPSAGYIPLYLIDITHNQTTITQGEILTAGPVATAESYQVAPILQGLLNSHHTGVVGSAPQILLTSGTGQEVTGYLPVANMVASNTTGAVSAMKTYAGNPNGNLAGNTNTNGAADTCWDSVSNVLYVCSATGSASTAVWTSIGGGGGSGGTNTRYTVFSSSGSYTPTSGTTHIIAKIVGGGGGGGGGDSNVFSSQSAAGGGGGGGGGGMAVIATPVSALTVPVSITIGTGGAGGGAGNGNTHSHVAATAGGNGGTTYFGSYAYAQGGNGGAPGYGGAPGGTSATGSTGSLNGYVVAGSCGGNTGVDSAGAGGASGLGTGGGRGGCDGAGASTGAAYGGGGGGGALTGNAGAAGANGCVIIEELIGY